MSFISPVNVKRREGNKKIIEAQTFHEIQEAYERSQLSVNGETIAFIENDPIKNDKRHFLKGFIGKNGSNKYTLYRIVRDNKNQKPIIKIYGLEVTLSEQEVLMQEVPYNGGTLSIGKIIINHHDHMPPIFLKIGSDVA